MFTSCIRLCNKKATTQTDDKPLSTINEAEDCNYDIKDNCAKSRLNQIYKFFKRLFDYPISALIFYLFTLAILTNISYLFQKSYDADVLRVKLVYLCEIIAITSLEVYSFCGIIKILDKVHIGKLICIVISLFLNICIIADYFCLFEFSKILSQDVIDIIAETNYSEAIEFLSTYLNLGFTVVAILFLVAFNLWIYYLSKIIVKIRYVKPIFITFVIIGCLVLMTSAVNFIRYRNGNSLPQFTSLTRIGYSCYISNRHIAEIDGIADIYEIVDATKEPDNTAIIFVIGESYSKYHCSAYGYKLKTAPNIERRIKDGEMVKFNDVVTVDDHTAGVMTAIFKMDYSNPNSPMFPMLFKKAGYRVKMYDNQYFVGQGISILSSEKLSKRMFDERNNNEYSPEGKMIEDINVDKMSLTIVHLMGQHYKYSVRYPLDKFSVFTSDDYSSDIPKYQREIIAHYDNATLYNDSVIESLIQKVEDKDVVMVYLPDHGEEIYDYRDYCGHGNAANASNIDYQISIPMFIWMSDKYKQSHQLEVERIKESEDFPISSGDISNFLVDLAGIKSSYLTPQRSFISSEYDKSKHRIVLHSIDYDIKRGQN